MSTQPRGLVFSQSEAPASQCRCVVWAEPAEPAVAGLMRGIDSRGAKARAVTAAADVMVELARGARVVIVHRPAQRPSLARLLTAVARYYPKAMLWRFEPDGAGLVKFPAAPARSAAAADGNGHVSAPKPAPTPPREPEALITPDELAMLLGPRDV